METARNMNLSKGRTQDFQGGGLRKNLSENEVRSAKFIGGFRLYSLYIFLKKSF